MPTPISFELHGISELSYWFREPRIDLEAVQKALSFDINARFNPNEDSTIDTVIAIAIELDSSDTQVGKANPPLVKYEAVFRFKINGIDFTPQPDEEEGLVYIQFPTGFLGAIAGVAYSTCRGILFTRTAGSQLQQFVLPITNPASLVGELNDRLKKRLPAKAEATEEVVDKKPRVRKKAK